MGLGVGLGVWGWDLGYGMYVDRRWFVVGGWEEVDTDLRFFEFLKDEVRGVFWGRAVLVVPGIC